MFDPSVLWLRLLGRSPCIGKRSARAGYSGCPGRLTCKDGHTTTTRSHGDPPCTMTMPGKVIILSMRPSMRRRTNRFRPVTRNPRGRVPMRDTGSADLSGIRDNALRPDPPDVSPPHPHKSGLTRYFPRPCLLTSIPLATWFFSGNRGMPVGRAETSHETSQLIRRRQRIHREVAVPAVTEGGLRRISAAADVHRHLEVVD